MDPDTDARIERASGSDSALAADLIRSAGDAIIALDPDVNIIFWNAAAEELFGWTAEQMIGQPMAVLSPPDRLHEQDQIMRTVVDHREQACVETTGLHKNGGQIPLSCRVAALTDADGHAYGVSVIIRDIEREVGLRRELERGRQQALARYAHSVIAQLTTDPRGVIISANEAMCRLVGWPSEEAAFGRSVLELIPPEDVDWSAAVLQRLSAGEVDHHRHERRLLHTAGHLIETRVTVYVVRGIDGKVERLDAVYDDISDELAVQRALQASEEKWRHLARNSADVALLCDAAGRIRFVSPAITQRFGYHPDDLVGADGFTFFHPDDEPAVRHWWQLVVSEPGTAATVQARVRAANGHWRWVADTMSNYLDVPDVAAIVVNLVDVSGRESMTPAVHAVVDDLRRGLLAREFEVHYQPVISLRTGAVSGAEALVRWQHPEQGLLGPGAFMEAAEASGLIQQLGEQVLTAACAAAASWESLAGGEQPFQVAVNLSALQLAAPGAAELIREHLDRAGASPRNLMLEVTESAVMADVATTSATLEQLRAVGVAIAVDNFGSGYSSLSYIKRFPITAIKIDRSFVAGLGVDDDDAAIVASVISLARAIDVGCIAEGVETHQQRRALQALQCDRAQGYLWSPAVDPDQFQAWVAEHDPASVLATTASAPEPERGRRASPRPTASAAALARIFAMQSAGASLSTIAAALNADQVPTADGKRWHNRSVARVIAGSAGSS